LKGKNIHSILIVAPPHVSKFFRVLKNLTAFSDHPHIIQSIMHHSLKFSVSDRPLTIALDILLRSDCGIRSVLLLHTIMHHFDYI
jgi:hypothetical protein